MRSGTSATMTPSQRLISTIYKQSWHPVASTKTTVIPVPKPASDGPKVAGNLCRKSPFQTRLPPPQGGARRACGTGAHQRSCIWRSSNHSRSVMTESSSRIPVRNSTRPTRLRSTSETPYTMFTKTNEATDFNVSTPENNNPSLGTWRRKLKTCVTSNGRSESVNSLNHDAYYASSSCSSIQLWSNEPNKNSKSHRAMYHPNSTLASICVRGKDPPVKQRASVRERHSASSTFQTILASFGQGSGTHDRSLSTSSSDSFYRDRDSSYQRDNNDDVTMDRSISSDIETGSDEGDDIRECEPVAMFDGDVPDIKINGNLVNGENRNEKRCSDYDETMPNLDLVNLNFNQTSETPEMNETSSSVNDSDISEQEMTSDDDDLDGSDDEESRCVVEKYKQMYERENKSNVDGDDSDNADCDITDDDCVVTRTPKYQFSAVFPKKFEKYKLRELSMLPYDVNWRSVVAMSDLCPTSSMKQKRHHHGNACRARVAKTLEEKKVLESMVDRLLSMEKLQTLTKQSEIIRKYHSAHVRASNKQKSAQIKNLSSSNSLANDAKSADGNTATPRLLSRRRSSITSGNSRLAWVNEMSRGDNNVFEQARKNGDLTILHDSWLANSTRSKSHLSSGDLRRASESCKSTDVASSRKNKKFRCRSSLPRYYVYDWSARVREDKYKQTSFYVSKSRSCSTCREKIRKLNENVSSPRSLKSRRPSTAGSVSSAATNRPNIFERLSTRPPPKPTYQSISTPSVASVVPSSLKTLNHRTFQSSADIIKLTNKDYSMIAQYSRRRQSKPVFDVGQRLDIPGPELLSAAFKVSSVAFNRRPISNK